MVGSNGTVEKNRITNNPGHGLVVEGSGTTITRNTSVGNGGVDFRNLGVDNEVTKNRFGTEDEGGD